MRAATTKWLLVVLAAASFVAGLSLMGGHTSAARATPSERSATASPVVSIQPTAVPVVTSTASPRATPTRPALKTVPSPRPHLPAIELPKLLSIPSIGVTAEFEYVGITADGAMDVPKDATKVAWYQLGPRPGEPGNAAIAGHVDWGGKTAIFWRLRELQPGDDVRVTAMDGRQFDFSVQWLHWYEASETDLGDVFNQSDAREMTLITCGGEFDSQTRQYLRRVVVRAGAR